MSEPSSRNLLMPPDMVADTRDNMLSPSWADAWQYNAQAAQDWVNQQRGISAQRGLWNDQTGMPTRAGILDAAQQTGNALLMGMTAPASKSFSPFDIAPQASRMAPKANYRGTLDAHAEHLFRQASPDDASLYLPTNVTYDGMHMTRPYFADHPSMATGQGENSGGIMLAFDPSKIQGQINTAKPAWQQAFENGYGEYVGTHNSQTDYQGALSAVRVPSNLEVNKLQKVLVGRGLTNLVKQGWSQVKGDGYTDFIRP